MYSDYFWITFNINCLVLNGIIVIKKNNKQKNKEKSNIAYDH